MAARRIFRGLTDMHCHVLPGVDDGPKTMDETEAVLKEAVSQGISTIQAAAGFSEEILFMRYSRYAACLRNH